MEETETHLLMNFAGEQNGVVEEQCHFLAEKR